MALLMLSLDNTVLNRAAAFRAWAQQFLAGIRANPDDLSWLMNVDADGLTSRWDMADVLLDRYRLGTSAYALAEELHEGPLRHLRLEPVVALALRIAREAGCTPVVVTNGTVREAEDRIRVTGLDRFIADWVVAEDVGVSKPNPRIFATAAGRLGMPLDRAWVVGDSPEADIRGAVELGVPSVWIARGRQWTETRFHPTRVADGVVAAISEILAAGRPAPPAPAWGYRGYEPFRFVA